MAQALHAARVNVVFGLLGNSNLATVGLLAERGVSFIGSRHESGAVAMAMGHAWATGTPAFCTVTHGPGLSNALTPLTSAVRDHLPLVLFVSDISAGPAWLAQRADHRAMTAWTGAQFMDCPTADSLAASVMSAFETATRQRRPVVLNVPVSVLDGAAPDQHSPVQMTTEAIHDDECVPALATAAELLRSAQLPVILAGNGAIRAAAGPDLRILADLCGALLTTTLPAKGLFAGDPFDAGVCGGYSDRTTRELLARADCIAAFGASLNGYTTDGGVLVKEKSVIHCDLDPSALGRHTPVDVPVVGDARSVAAALAAAISASAGASRQDRGYRTPDVAQRIEAAHRGADYPDQSDEDGLDTRVALRTLDAIFPADRQVVIDLGHFSTFPIQAITLPGAGRFLPTFGFGSVGLAVAAGVGAAVGRSTPTLVVVGDGGALMSLEELDTVRRVGAPVTIVVLNDDAYSAEIHHLRRRGLDDRVARFPHCDLAAIASALGLASFGIRTAADLQQLAGVVGGEIPTLLDVSVTERTVADKFR